MSPILQLVWKIWFFLLSESTPRTVLHVYMCVMAKVRNQAVSVTLSEKKLPCSKSLASLVEWYWWLLNGCRYESSKWPAGGLAYDSLISRDKIVYQINITFNKSNIYHNIFKKKYIHKWSKYEVNKITISAQ